MCKKITFVASECQPFFASGGLGDVIGSLPSRIVKEGANELDVTVFLPLYSSMTAGYRNKLVYVGQINVKLSWRIQYCGIYKYENKGVKYYFLDNEYYLLTRDLNQEDNLKMFRTRGAWLFICL